MKLKHLLRTIAESNPEAEVKVIANCKKYDFTLTYGDSEGSTEFNCDSIGFYVDELCTSEKTK
jgi:hypothetical protein